MTNAAELRWIKRGIVSTQKNTKASIYRQIAIQKYVRTYGFVKGHSLKASHAAVRICMYVSGHQMVQSIHLSCRHSIEELIMSQLPLTEGIQCTIILCRALMQLFLYQTGSYLSHYLIFYCWFVGHGQSSLNFVIHFWKFGCEVCEKQGPLALQPYFYRQVGSIIIRTYYYFQSCQTWLKALIWFQEATSTYVEAIKPFRSLLIQLLECTDNRNISLLKRQLLYIYVCHYIQ